jgi:P27 family predicted phage terminase small subunit
MGKRGPAPKPTALKVIQGTYRKDRAARREPKPRPKVPSCPSWLNRDGKREWRRVVKELDKLGLVSELDRTSLAAYCQAFGEWREHARIVGEEGTTTISAQGTVIPHPEVHMRNDAFRRMVKQAAEFGMTPASRTRINGPEEIGEPENEFAAFKVG